MAVGGARAAPRGCVPLPVTAVASGGGVVVVVVEEGGAGVALVEGRWGPEAAVFCGG